MTAKRRALVIFGSGATALGGWEAYASSRRRAPHDELANTWRSEGQRQFGPFSGCDLMGTVAQTPRVRRV